MATGVVRFFNAAKGFGLVTPDLGGPAIFAHQAAVKATGGRKLMATQRVEFDLVLSPDGSSAATNIRILA
jgi:CspA family cold shock protein